MKPNHNKGHEDKKNPQQPANPNAEPHKKEHDKNAWQHPKKDGGCGSCGK